MSVSFAFQSFYLGIDLDLDQMNAWPQHSTGVSAPCLGNLVSLFHIQSKTNECNNI